MAKVIGCIPLYDDEKDSYWMVPGYMKMLEDAGAVPLMLPLTDDDGIIDYFMKICGGFLLTGGHDVTPSLYSAAKSEKCGTNCPTRDSMEKKILSKSVAADKSVLGICRGIQLMNVCLGGDLYQDLPSEHPSGTEHHMSAPYDRVAHFVKLLSDTPLRAIIGKDRIGVNSYHHQAIKKLAPVLTAEAMSDDGLTEAAYMPGKRFIRAVQWHPEFSYKTDENSRKIVAAFVASCPEE